MKQIHVAAAVICDRMEQPTRVFATARGYGEQKGQWEFPGGKLELGETAEQALLREIREELDTVIRVGGCLGTVEYDYPAFHLTMECFLCQVVSGELRLKEAEAAGWLTRETLYRVPWLPADRVILPEIETLLSE